MTTQKTDRGVVNGDGSVLASVIIPAFNGADVLAGAVDSALASIDAAAAALPALGQGAVEVVVSDDGSTDGTWAEIGRLMAADGRVRGVRSRVNRGAGPARNAGVAAARGEILLFLDADDRFLPPHVGACISELLRHPEAGLVKTDIAVDSPLHPEWRHALRVTVVFNTAVWRACHDFVGGFHEEPEFKALRVEDVFWCDSLMANFITRGIELETVVHTVRAGNAFDGQRAKFALAPGALANDRMQPEQAAVLPTLRDHQARRAEEIAARRSGYAGPAPLRD